MLTYLSNVLPLGASKPKKERKKKVFGAVLSVFAKIGQLRYLDVIGSDGSFFRCYMVRWVAF